jgi:hypothetical protein
MKTSYAFAGKRGGIAEPIRQSLIGESCNISKNRSITRLESVDYRSNIPADLPAHSGLIYPFSNLKSQIVG